MICNVYQGGTMTRQVEINAGESLQCCRVTDGEQDEANQLWFMEPATAVADGELVGVLLSDTQMVSMPIVLRFNSSAAILPIIQDLAIIYGNLVKQGV